MYTQILSFHALLLYFSLSRKSPRLPIDKSTERLCPDSEEARTSETFGYKGMKLMKIANPSMSTTKVLIFMGAHTMFNVGG